MVSSLFLLYYLHTNILQLEGKIHVSKEDPECWRIYGEGLCIFTFLYFPDSRLDLLNGFDFYFWWRDSENQIPESVKFLLMESDVLGVGIQNTARGIRNPTNDWNPESKSYWQIMKSSTWNRESTAWNPESKTVLDSPTWSEAIIAGSRGSLSKYLDSRTSFWFSTAHRANEY